MSDKIREESQKLELPSAFVTLFVIDASVIDGSTIFRFTPMTDAGPAAVLFDGDTYTPIDLEATGFDWDGGGQPPEPKLKLSNVQIAVQAAVISLGDMIGATLTRIRTLEQFLDTGADPDPTAVYPLDVFLLERKLSHNKIQVEWALSAAIDQEGEMLPKRQVIREVCTHRYRQPDGVGGFDYTDATCPYVDTPSFNRDGTPTTAPFDDCGQRLFDCRLRFGQNAVLPTRKFPGVGLVV